MWWEDGIMMDKGGIMMYERGVMMNGGYEYELIHAYIMHNEQMVFHHLCLLMILFAISYHY